MTGMTEQLALITGASRGLGYALALELCKTHHIVAVAKTTGALEELDDQIKAQGGAATLAPMDINNEAAMATLCRGIFDRWGKLDIWLHTAVHAAPLAPADHIDLTDMAKSIDTNLTAVTRLIGYVSPLLGQDGHAVFFDDARAGEKFFGAYGATKTAQTALVRSWATETQRTGPKASMLSPSAMPTATRARFFPGEDRKTLSDCETQAKILMSDIL